MAETVSLARFAKLEPANQCRRVWRSRVWPHPRGGTLFSRCAATSCLIKSYLPWRVPGHKSFIMFSLLLLASAIAVALTSTWRTQLTVFFVPLVYHFRTYFYTSIAIKLPKCSSVHLLKTLFSLTLVTLSSCTADSNFDHHLVNGTIANGLNGSQHVLAESRSVNAVSPNELSHHHNSHRHLLSSQTKFMSTSPSPALSQSFNKLFSGKTFFASESATSFESDKDDSNLSHKQTELGDSNHKRKRELLALTFGQDQPFKVLGKNTFWTHPTTNTRRLRRLARLHSTGTNSQSTASFVSSASSSSLPIYAKVNLKSSKLAAMSSLSALSSSSSSFMSFSASSSVSSPGANSGGNNRMKILPPAGFGTAFGSVPPKKNCNFEIYPSGCFDENGSICDTSGSNLCVCRPGYSIRIGNIYCLRPASIGEACYTTEQCERKVANSGCFNYREEYREENPSAFFGPSQSSWPMGECRCRTGHRYEKSQNACVRSIIGSWCSNVWDCEIVTNSDAEATVASESSGHPRANHTRASHWATSHSTPHSSHSPVNTARSKLANIVCENNICNCSQHFYYNKSSEECQFVETFGQSCLPTESSGQSKRSARMRELRMTVVTNEATDSPVGVTVGPESHFFEFYKRRDKRSVTRHERSDPSVVRCNMPTVCSANRTCACAEGYEHQPSMVPQCQPIGGSHLTHYYHSGSSIRSGVKGDHGGGGLYDRSAHYEGQSNVANFAEYVLYVLVPALVIIFMFKPCFRRIGEWRNHIHHYQSDSDFYLAAAATGIRPVIAEMNVIAPPCAEKAINGPTPSTDMFASEFASFAFGSHLGCHNAYLFEPADPCYATPVGYGFHSAPTSTGQNQSSVALVKEKLQTIEECQSEDGLTLGPVSIEGSQCVDCSAPSQTGDSNTERDNEAKTTENEVDTGQTVPDCEPETEDNSEQ